MTAEGPKGFKTTIMLKLGVQRKKKEQNLLNQDYLVNLLA